MYGFNAVGWETAVCVAHRFTGFMGRAGTIVSIPVRWVTLCFFALLIGLPGLGCPSFKTVVYTPTLDLQSQVTQDTTTQYQATVTHNLASDTITILARKPVVSSSTVDQSVYIYGLAYGMELERALNLTVLANLLNACTPDACIDLQAAVAEIKQRSYPDYGTVLPCTISLDKTVFYSGAPESNWTVTVTAPPGCSWTAVSDIPWIVLTVQGSILYVRALANTGPFRQGHFTLAGVTYLISQE